MLSINYTLSFEKIRTKINQDFCAFSVYINC